MPTTAQLNLVALVAISAVIALGRFTIPGHGLTYAGSYEAFAHIWVGMLCALIWFTRPRWPIIVSLVAITIVEIVMFIAQKGH